MRYEMIDLKAYRGFSRVLVETGTSAGDGVWRALMAGYEDIRSVELSDEWYSFSYRKYCNDKRVKLWHGKSSEWLGEMIPSEERCVIVLDAHPAGSHTAGHDDLMKWRELGDETKSEFAQDNILCSEVEIIVKKSGGRDLIIVDDQVGINEKLVGILPVTYRYEYINEKYMVCLPSGY